VRTRFTRWLGTSVLAAALSALALVPVGRLLVGAPLWLTTATTFVIIKIGGDAVSALLRWRTRAHGLQGYLLGWARFAVVVLTAITALTMAELSFGVSLRPFLPGLLGYAAFVYWDLEDA